MPALFAYLLKLSCSLAVVYLFYQLVLRRLTFYNANRWYLLGYSLLCFFIPLINISGVIEQHQISRSAVIRAIPTVDNYTHTTKLLAQNNTANSFTAWDYSFLFLVIGIIVLLMRLLVQYASYRILRKQAHLISNDGIAIYQVSKSIIPFSFGNSIFINQGQHSEAELKEIIRHEFVHVMQRHTVDIICAETLCILNWYNPFAWLLRHAVRQNLEFIADNNVLESGIDKRAYQYLLLKVMGLPQFSIAAPFNFSSLKKRIVMMNKMKSAKAHLVKFLFVLPLLAVLLLAFRNDMHKKASKKEPVLTVSGLVIDAVTKAPLAGVSVHEINSNAVATSDNRGFFSIAIPMMHNPLQTEVWFRKDGFENIPSNSIITTQKSMDAIGTIEIICMSKKGAKRNRGFVQSFALSDQNTSVSTVPTYDEVLKNFTQTKAFREGINVPTAALPKTGVDTLPAPAAPSSIVGMPNAMELPEDYTDFLKRNPNVRNIHWGEHTVTIELKSGGKETYNWNDAKSMAAAERKWGKLPVAPPPPPPPPTVMPPAPPTADTTNLPNDPMNAYIQKQEFLTQQLAQWDDSAQNGENNTQAEAIKAYLQQQLIAQQNEQVQMQKYIQKKAAKANNQKIAAVDEQQQRKVMQKNILQYQRDWEKMQQDAEKDAKKQILQMHQQQQYVETQMQIANVKLQKERAASQLRIKEFKDSLEKKADSPHE